MNQRVFQWVTATAWIAATRWYLVEMAGAGIFERFHRHPPDTRLTADAPWLSATVGSSRALAELMQTLVHRLTMRYDVLQAFHAGRPAELASYLTQGILPAAPERLIDGARDIFCGPTHPCVSVGQLEALISQQHLTLIDGRLGFALDKRYLTQVDTFYVHYGSH